MSLKPANPPLVYDENLLAQAPEVTQGQRQEGYDADILNPSPPPTSRTPAPSQPYRDHNDVESGSSGHDKHLAAGGYDHVGQSAKKPFWKTPKGMIILAVLAVTVVAAVVGGAVGGTVGKNKNNSETTGPGPEDTSGNNPNSLPTLSPTSAAPPPGETTSGRDTPGGGGSNQSSSSRLDGASPTPTSSVPRPPTTTAAVTPPSVEPPSQPGPGNGV